MAQLETRGRGLLLDGVDGALRGARPQPNRIAAEAVAPQRSIVALQSLDLIGRCWFLYWWGFVLLGARLPAGVDGESTDCGRQGAGLGSIDTRRRRSVEASRPGVVVLVLRHVHRVASPGSKTVSW